MERTVNRVSLVSLFYLDGTEDKKSVKYLAGVVVNCWRAKLQRQFPHRKFEVHLSIGKLMDDNDNGLFDDESVVLTFHEVVMQKTMVTFAPLMFELGK